LLENEGYVVFLLKASLAHELDPAFVKAHLIEKLDIEGAGDMILLMVSEYFNARGEVGEAEKILRLMYKRS
jgi:hypothetical protein